MIGDLPVRRILLLLLQSTMVRCSLTTCLAHGQDIQLTLLLALQGNPKFLEIVTNWQRKLGTVDVVLNTWLDVQKKWQALESIFVGSADIRVQLPEDSKRFDVVNADFQASSLASVSQILAHSHIHLSWYTGTTHNHVLVLAMGTHHTCYRAITTPYCIFHVNNLNVVVLRYRT